MFNRVFVLVVIGAIIAVLTIMLIIVWVLGDNEPQGENTGPPETTPSLVHDYLLVPWRTGTA